MAGSQSREAAVPALRGVQRPFPEGRREGGAGKVALVAEEAGCPQSDQLTEATVCRPLQAWLPGLPVCAGLTFCVGQPVPTCAGPRVAVLLWACPARGLPLHKLRGLEGRGGLEGVHVAEEAVGSTGQRFLLRGAVAEWASSPHRRTLD